jgi:anti-anti-sigma regulatory factor
MQIDLTEITGIYGKKNSGKSVLFEHLLTQTERYLCLDPNHEHGPPGSVAVSSPAEVLTEWLRGNTRQVVRDAPLTEDKLVNYCRAFGQLKGAYLYIDEVHNYMDAHNCPDVLEDLSKWHATHNNCGIVLASQQAKSINDAIFQHMDTHFIFHYGSHEDSKLRELGPETVQKVRNLDFNSYQFVYFHDVTGGEPAVAGPVDIPDHLG